MKITFISIFPEYFEGFKDHSIIKRAIASKKIIIEVINPRDFADKGIVDDTVYGGGPGMLLLIEPLVKALEATKTKDSKVFLLGPRGTIHNQENAKALINFKHIIFICGHYEGVDARIKYYIDGEISIGEFIITGGEQAAMLVADSLIRLIPDVIKKESHENESFENNLIECDHFSKPANFAGHEVPEVLLSGNHQEINKWRKQNAIDNTIELIQKKKGK